MLFISGIDTEIGKTLIAAIVTEALEADYWKPIQSGDLHYTDTNKVQALISNTTSQFHPESYALKIPASPHYSAAEEGVTISLATINPPFTNNRLVAEGAGGLLVPLNNNDLLIDAIKQLGCAVILVSKNYLGSINHTLLSVKVLQQYQIPIAGIIFNGTPTPSTENYIAQYTQVPILGHIPWAEKVDKTFVRHHAQLLKATLTAVYAQWN